MDLRSRTVVRALFVALVLLSLALLGFGFVKWSVIEGGASVLGSSAEPVAPANGTTVVTTSMQGDNRIVAYAANGSVLYHNSSYLVYDDVDPSPRGKYTVTYVATEYVDRAECDSTGACGRNVVVRTNLSTGESERLFSRVTSTKQGHWHDVDRLGPHRLVVADIAHDRVFVVNTTTGVETWSWHAQDAYDVTSGGVFPGDWTHVNDVEVLPDGRIMVSLRNQDSVVFVDPQRGYQANWTLGADGNHSILFEQHNPDYVPASNGGPAVVIADSENNRVVEYQRRDGSWVRTWTWSGPSLQWPRDADRLPNGNTLITDTNGGRVIEINEQGEIVWSMAIKGPYEAERLGTGGESAGGPSAVRADLASRREGGSFEARDDPLWEEIADGAANAWAEFLPNRIENGLLYVLPPWIGVVELGGLFALPLVLLAWGATEVYWSSYRFRRPIAKGGDGES